MKRLIYLNKKTSFANGVSKAKSFRRFRNACLFLIGLFCSPSSATASFGIYESYVVIGGVYYDLFANTGNPDFSGNFFGTFQTNGTLTFNGGEIKTFKENQNNCPGGNVCIGNIYWVIKQGTNTVNSGTEILSFDSDLNINGCSQNQKWDETGGGTNLISGLAAGSYSLEVYCDADGDQNSNSGCGDKVVQAVLTATFEVEAAMPVNLANFYANKISTSTKLLWQTASEINNSHFNIERSFDSKKWETIGKVNGQGNSLQRNDYEFTDTRPLNGINYYRLKQVDFDGQFSYSKIVSVNFNREESPGIYPNPVAENLFIENIKNAEEGLRVFIYNAQGRLIKEQMIRSENNIAVSDLSPGIYFITIQDLPGAYILSERFIKK